jgi:hypothetical protein
LSKELQSAIKHNKEKEEEENQDMNSFYREHDQIVNGDNELLSNSNLHSSDNLSEKEKYDSDQSKNDPQRK